MSADVVSKQARAQQWLDETIAQRCPIKVVCAKCGDTVGRYRPGRVAMPSAERPSVNFKCVRAGCRTETVVVLGEAID